MKTWTPDPGKVAELVAEATVDAYDGEEQLIGLAGLFDELDWPSRARVGTTVVTTMTVEQRERGLVALCAVMGDAGQMPVPVEDVAFPAESDHAMAAAAYRSWLARPPLLIPIEPIAAPIDRTATNVFLAGLDRRELQRIVERAVSILPDAAIEAILGDGTEIPRIDAGASGVVAEVEAFYRASIAGEYFEGFNVNSKNYRRKSAGTRTWIAECNRLLNRVADLAKEQDYAGARRSYDRIFELCDRIDDHEDIIFFADEWGAWQVGVRWGDVLPNWFECVAATAAPEDFARDVLSRLPRVARDGRSEDELISHARDIASKAQ